MLADTWRAIGPTDVFPTGWQLFLVTSHLPFVANENGGNAPNRIPLLLRHFSEYLHYLLRVAESFHQSCQCTLGAAQEAYKGPKAHFPAKVTWHTFV